MQSAEIIQSEIIPSQNPPLWAHQYEAIRKAGKFHALFFDPGCGKSRTVIELYKRWLPCAGVIAPGNSEEQFRMVPMPSKAIIFAPLNVCRNWENELALYLGLPYKTFLVSGQTKARKIKILTEFAETVAVSEHLFLICNIEALRSKEYREILGDSEGVFVVCDESHNFKSPTSQQTKGLFEVLNKLKPENLYLLTGTPAPQGEIDLYTTFALLKRTKDTFFVWRKKFFVDKNERRRGGPNYWPDYKITEKSKEYFSALLRECSTSARKNSVLDLPPLLRTNIYSEMSPEQKRHYDTMTEYLFAIDTDGNELNAANMLTRTLRLQQILAGFIGDAPIVNNPRLLALDAAIEKTGGAENGEPFIIWTIFKATYKQLETRLQSLGVSVGMITGEQGPDERQDTMNLFQSGKLRALIAHPKAGGVGVNLTAASYSIHYTRSFSLTDDLQAEARNYRGGSERHKRITRIDIITPDTIDEDIAKALREKKTVQDFILGLKQKREALC